MYQILHNKTNGVDVDKFEFILKDSFFKKILQIWIMA